MNLSLAAMALLSLSLGQSNLDFSKKSLEKWDGQGFAYTNADVGAWSHDAVAVQRKGMVRYLFAIPNQAIRITFRAYAKTEQGDPDQRLEVVLASKNNVPLARRVKTSTGWREAPQLLSSWIGKPREYSWDVTALAGQTAQIVLIDNDNRPGHYVFAGDFRIHASAPLEPNLDADFTRFMLELRKKRNLSPFARFDSKRYVAISNASEDFTKERLQNCEIFYDHFVSHFQKQGFTVTPPTQRLMLAIFEDHNGFDAYFGQIMPAGIAGVYHTPTNRLVLYDLKENRAIAASKKNALSQGMRINDVVQKWAYVETTVRKFNDISNDLNLSTTMHECAHLIAFNCGLLQHDGDAACWVVEGMATYCEATDQGDWTSLGGPNPMRIRDLMHARGKHIPLIDLVRNDDWRNTSRVISGYAQSWALFHMLFRENPQQLRSYLKGTATRKTSEHRLGDFQEAFGSLESLQQRHVAYIQRMIKEHPPGQLR